VTDLARLLSAELLDALDAIIGERVAEAVAVALQEQTPARAWLTVSEAAGYLHASERTIERRIAAGDVRTTVLGRRRLIARDSLDALLEAAAGREQSPDHSTGRRNPE
jgi:excisionase family DNA binding protein